MRWIALLLLSCMAAARADVFILPTPNRALLESGPSEKFLVGTVGRPWPSGGFGCVRSDGLKMHEGLDIRCTQRDARGEPIDPVFASASGTVAYISDKPALSNFGRYIVLRHNIEGLQVCTLYAHLSSIASGLAAGQTVRQGQTIATMGRSTNTREGISKERAHLHFEIDFALNDRYASWHAQYRAGTRNDHGSWNGQNLAAVDPAPILRAAAREGASFSLVKHLRARKEAFRILARDSKFSFLRQYPALVKRNPAADREGAAGYQISFDFNGAPIELTPQAPSEIRSGPRIQLLSANREELEKNRCSRFVTYRNGQPELSNTGELRSLLLIH